MNTALKFSLGILSSGLLIASCAGLKSMEKKIKELEAKSNPDPLELVGDSIDLAVSGKFPPKYFGKKVYAEATPVLVYPGGEAKFKMQAYQGEKAAGNGIVVPYKEGKAISYSSRVGYAPGMESSKLELRIAGKEGSKQGNLPPVAMGEGVITTCLLVKTDDKCIWSTDNFVRTLSYTNDSTQVNFDYNSAVLKPAELKDADMTALGNFFKRAAANPRMKIKKVEFLGYASPEGEILLNDNLAQERSDAGKKAFENLAASMNLTSIPAGALTVTPKGEDWEGFRTAMEKSNIDDRNIIINVLKMTTDLTEREKEIKNISKTYLEIQKDIFPSLRRCRFVVSYDLEGYSDAELIQIGSSNPSSLKYEELMKAGSLVEDLDKKAAIYLAATKLKDADYRSFNNLGCVYYMQNKLNDANTQWSKSYGMKKCAETSNNMAVYAHVNGDRKAAGNYLKEAGSAKETSYNKGIIDIQNGNYGSAVSSMSSFKTFNTSLAKLLNKDNGGAKADLDASNDTSAKADYLRAIICARTNDGEGVQSNLAKAYSKDASLKEKAMKDLEFRNFRDKQ
jgi:outer membrane protein OmpA-like peptidoglycan-associated protein